MRVGGFFRVPTKRELLTLKDKLEWARDAAVETILWVATLPYPDFEQDYEFVALRHPDEYPYNEGHVVSSKGIDIPVQKYEEFFREEHVEHSTALHSVVRGTDNYFVGPLARYNLNFDKLPAHIQKIARDINFEPPVRNPFKSIIVRAIETLYAIEEALRIIDQYERPAQPYVEAKPRAGIGCGCTEAPRGILYHRYRIGDDGAILDAKITPPTSQNQKTIEKDVWHFVETALDLPEDQLVWQCEQAVRNYDPCISCSTHYLKLEMDRE